MTFNLEMSAMRWLWLQKNCKIVLEQRAPRHCMGEPDVIGVTPGRYLIEIEVKRSAQDFMNDAKKHHRIQRDFTLKHQARQLYYLMPFELAMKMKDRMPNWAGLMASKFDPHIEVIIEAPVNRESAKLDLKQCVKLARCMTNHMMSYAMKVHSMRNSFRDKGNFDWEDYAKPEDGVWTI